MRRVIFTVALGLVALSSTAVAQTKQEQKDAHAARKAAVHQGKLEAKEVRGEQKKVAEGKKSEVRAEKEEYKQAMVDVKARVVESKVAAKAAKVQSVVDKNSAKVESKQVYQQKKQVARTQVLNRQAETASSLVTFGSSVGYCPATQAVNLTPDHHQSCNELTNAGDQSGDKPCSCQDLVNYVYGIYNCHESCIDRLFLNGKDRCACTPDDARRTKGGDECIPRDNCRNQRLAKMNAITGSEERTCGLCISFVEKVSELMKDPTNDIVGIRSKVENDICMNKSSQEKDGCMTMVKDYMETFMHSHFDLQYSYLRKNADGTLNRGGLRQARVICFYMALCENSRR